MSKVLVIAFDGMDKELIEDFDLEIIPQEEFGTIDIDTGITAKVTYELFASFITGKTHSDHGVIGLVRPKNDFLFKIDSLKKHSIYRKTNGIRKRIFKNIPFVEGGTRAYDRKDLQTPTIFDHIENSKVIDVPSYSIGYKVDIMEVMARGGVKEADEESQRFTDCKKKELFQSMEQNHNLIMAHFHRPDHIHHWYWEVGKMDKVEETYREMDEFAGQILDKAEEQNFEHIIFFSDHGLPDVENGGHNKNAFYSCNHELFDSQIPHITDFHDKILDLTGNRELERVDF